jgi:UDP-N-acetylglucosamine--N-acetylmuramyl-(pentapeptide) pyrophosphoryl-undecaprenol N-acetylglucosamine transferase
MKIVFTGGGTGGHFYPLMAVAEEMNNIINERDLIRAEMYYLSNTPYDEKTLEAHNITYKHVSAGKLRRYFSLKNGIDFFKSLVGLPTALSILFRIYPDVVFSKGGYASVPVVLAARLLRIPVFVHDSDAIPGRANLWAGKFAERVAVSYPEAADYFKKSKHVAYTGNPTRKRVGIPQTHGSHEHFNFSPDIPTLLFMGGSQGAEHMNRTLLQALDELLPRYQIIHQIGKEKYEAFTGFLQMELGKHEYMHHYRPFPFLEELDLRNAAGCADLIISRAGSGSIFNIASWGKPSILVPIPEDVSRDQRKNAFAYARSGGAEVIEQENFTYHVLISEIDRLMNDSEVLQRMREGAKAFAKPDAAHNIAYELVKMMLEHEI